MKYGFVKVAAAIPQVKIADCQYNAEQVVAGAGRVGFDACDE